MQRKVKILATLGPASSKPGTIRKLIEAGINGVRLNFSHGDHAGHKALYTAVRKTADAMKKPLAVIADLQGPKIRVGDLAEPVLLGNGETIGIGFKGAEGILPCTYRNLLKDIQKGDRILIDDGLIELKAVSLKKDQVVCRVLHGGIVKSRKGINLPGVAISASSITAKDMKDLEFAVKLGVDFIAVSFVRSGKGIRKVKRAMAALGREVPVIAKIEKPEALENLDDIMALSDGLMVARGDLAVETAPEQVPIYQKELLQRSNEIGQLDIVATQMLDSMVANLTPTRAEASDVANAVLDGADVVMLSQETAVGEHPVRVVEMMSKIICNAEQSSYFQPHVYIPDDSDLSVLNAITHSAGLAADETRADALVVYSVTGLATTMLSNKRPASPIIVFTPDTQLYNRYSLYYGIQPQMCAPLKGLDQAFRKLKQEIRKNKLLPLKSTVVFLIGDKHGQHVLRVDTV